LKTKITTGTKERLGRVGLNLCLRAYRGEVEIFAVLVIDVAPLTAGATF